MPLTHCKNSRTIRIGRDAQPSNRRFIGKILCNIDWSPLYYMNSCKGQFQYFSSVVYGIIENYLSLKRIKSDSSDKPWITSEIKGSISKRLYPKLIYCAGRPVQGFTVITLPTHCNQILTSDHATLRRLQVLLQKVSLCYYL